MYIHIIRASLKKLSSLTNQREARDAYLVDTDGNGQSLLHSML